MNDFFSLKHVIGFWLIVPPLILRKTTKGRAHIKRRLLLIVLARNLVQGKVY